MSKFITLYTCGGETQIVNCDFITDVLTNERFSKKQAINSKFTIDYSLTKASTYCDVELLELEDGSTHYYLEEVFPTEEERDTRFAEIQKILTQ